MRAVRSIKLQGGENMPDMDREELLGEDITDPNNTRDNVIIGIVAACLLALTILMGFSLR
jgi:hypothetical protein